MIAHAEWKYIDSTYKSDTYVDFSRITTEGRYKTMWSLSDHKSPQISATGKQFKSDVTKHLIDCQASKKQFIVIYEYSEKMGMGGLVFSANMQIQESEWRYPPPNSIGDVLINIACGIK